MSASIDRLSLRVPGNDPALGRRLGELVAERLAAPLALPPGDAAFDRLQVRVERRAGETTESLADRIATQIAHLVEAGR